MAAVYFNRFDTNRDGAIGPKEYLGREKLLLSFCPGLALDADVRREAFRARFTAPALSWPGQAFRNVVYKRVDGTALRMDVYSPLRNVFPAAPVLYYLHGGGWEDGLKEFLLTEKIKASLARRFGEAGFALVAVQYRLVEARTPAPRTLVRDCVVDAQDGLRFLAQHAGEFGLDPRNVVVWGESAGAHLAMMLACATAEQYPGDPELASSRLVPAAGISWYGPTDFTADFEINFRGPGSNRFAHRIAGASPTDLAARLREMSPYHALTPAARPLLVLHGDGDVAVSLEHATHLKSHADRIGAAVELVTVKHAGHNWRQVGDQPVAPSTDDIAALMLEFALKHRRR